MFESEQERGRRSREPAWGGAQGEEPGGGVGAETKDCQRSKRRVVPEGARPSCYPRNRTTGNADTRCGRVFGDQDSRTDRAREVLLVLITAVFGVSCGRWGRASLVYGGLWLCGHVCISRGYGTLLCLGWTSKWMDTDDVYFRLDLKMGYLKGCLLQ